MTFEELLEMPADDINKMSDEQLHAILDPYAPLCRPSAALTAFQPAALRGVSNALLQPGK
jgi:hypothetical protein